MMGYELALHDLAPTVELAWPGGLFLLFLIIGVPLLALWQPTDRDTNLPTRLQLYATGTIVLWLLAALTALVLLVEKARVVDVGLQVTGIGTLSAWALTITLGGLVIGFAVTRIGARLGARESRLVFHLMPRDRQERWAFLGLSVSAGFCEEFVYRGYVLAGLNAWLGSGWLAAGVASLAFGVLHGYQKSVGVVRAALLGYLFALPVIAGAGLWPAITAHFLMDALLGLGLWKWMTSEGQLATEV